MWIVLARRIQVNGKGIDAKKARQRKFAHCGGEREQGGTDDTGKNIGQDDGEECAPPATAQAISGLREYFGVDGPQTIIDGAIDEWK